MSNIETRCQGCGGLLSIDSDSAGARVRCPACRAELIAPVETDERALAAVCHYCGAAAWNEVLVDDAFRACDLCLDSIQQNATELNSEQERAASVLPRLLWIMVVAFLIWLAVWSASG